MMADKNSPKIAVLLPCYNEEGAIGAVVDAFNKYLPQAEIYVYDNNSTDNTADEAMKAGAIVRHEKYQGKGNVVRRMFRDIDADYYVMADGDGTYDAKDAAEMIALAMQGSDMVVGKRIDTEDEKIYRPGHVFGNHFITFIAGLFFGKGFNDILSGYRVFSKKFVKTFPAITGGFEVETELTIYALTLKMNVAEYDTLYYARKGETSSKLRTYRDGIKILWVMVRLFKDYKPLLLFTIVAAILGVIFLMFFIPVYLEYRSSGLVPRFPTFVASIFVLMLSMVSFFTGLILDSMARSNLTNIMQKFNIYESTKK
ncbi:MAG: glycosyltransferase [Alphaproteobacteria bacterium]|nr:glycosyltransferase [Alphaproteobacteria bacterium]